MRAGKDADLDRDRTNLVERAAVQPLPALERLVAHHLFLELLEDPFRVHATVRLGVGDAGEQFRKDPVDARIVLELVLDPHRRGKRGVRLALDLVVELLRVLLPLDLELLLPGVSREGLNAGHDFLDGSVRAIERLDHLLFGDFLRARFDHHDGVLAARHNQIETAAAPLLERRVDQELAIDQSDPHARDAARKRHAGDCEGRRRSGDGQHVAVVLDVGGEHERNDLRFVAPSGGEERSDRAIDEPAREHFLLARFAFALEETARNPAGRVRVLTVVDRQRQEIDAFARVRRGTGGHEDHGVARANDNGAVGLLGQPARLDRQRLSPDSDVACMHVSVFH